jgi:hypothetical protein
MRKNSFHIYLLINTSHAYFEVWYIGDFIAPCHIRTLPCAYVACWFAAVHAPMFK